MIAPVPGPSSATDCGADLTAQCILAKAGSHTNWDAVAWETTAAATHRKTEAAARQADLAQHGGKRVLNFAEGNVGDEAQATLVDANQGHVVAGQLACIT